MLTGRQPFQGDTAPDVLASVLVRDPDLESLPPNLNPRLHDLLRRCLEKTPKRRWQAIGDVRAEIETIAADPHGESAIAHAGAPPRPLWRRAIPIVATAIVASGLTGFGVWTARRSTPPSVGAIHADTAGRAAVHQRRPPVDRHLAGWDADRLRGQPAAVPPCRFRSWRPGPSQAPKANGGVVESRLLAGRAILLSSGRPPIKRLKRIAVTGGAPVTVCPAERPYGVRWDRDGILVGQGGKGILRVSASGGKPELLVSVKTGELAYGPELLPDGQTVLFTLATRTAAEKWDSAQVVAQSLKTGERRVIIDGGSDARYLPTGHLVYAQGGLLFATPFDPRRLSTSGGRGSDRRRRQAIGRRPDRSGPVQRLQYRLARVRSRSDLGFVRAVDLAFSDRTGVVEKLKLPSGAYEVPRISPDGKRLALGIDDARGANIWIYDLSTDELDSATDLWRTESLSSLDGGRSTGRVPVRSRGGSRDLLATRGWHRHGAASHQAGSGRITHP